MVSVIVLLMKTIFIIISLPILLLNIKKVDKKVSIVWICIYVVNLIATIMLNFYTELFGSVTENAGTICLVGIEKLMGTIDFLYILISIGFAVKNFINKDYKKMRRSLYFLIVCFITSMYSQIFNLATNIVDFEDEFIMAKGTISTYLLDTCAFFVLNFKNKKAK